MNWAQGVKLGGRGGRTYSGKTLRLAGAVRELGDISLARETQTAAYVLVLVGAARQLDGAASLAFTKHIEDQVTWRGGLALETGTGIAGQ